MTIDERLRDAAAALRTDLEDLRLPEPPRPDSGQGRHRTASLVLGAALLAAVAAFAVSQIADGDKPVSTAPSTQPSTDLDDLVGVDWFFTSMTFDDPRPALDLSDEVTELRFEEDGTYSAHVCNYLGGDYQVTGSGSLALEPGPQTMMGCGGTIGDAERAMNAQLAEAISWDVQGDELTLRAPGITASLRATQPVFPERLTILERADHPAALQYAIGYSGDPNGVQTVEILVRSDPSQEFATATVDSGRVLSPTGLTPPDGRTIVASWLPPNTAKAWVRLSTGGAEINLDLERLSNGRLLGWASLPERSGEIIAFDADGNEIDSTTPFDF